MSGWLVLAAYALAASGLILCAIVYALFLVWRNRHVEGRRSLDCLGRNHSACDLCSGCECHWAGAR